jgi:mRNA-degrading endonuclease toxin of MazEF toxin-antitoxin module
MRRGEIWWGAPTLPDGSRKDRPFVIVSDDAFNRNDRYTKVLVLHVTTVRRSGGPFAWEVALPGGAGGLSKPGVVKCGEVYTLFKRDLAEICGTLGREDMRRVDRALAVAMGLPR